MMAAVLFEMARSVTFVRQAPRDRVDVHEDGLEALINHGFDGRPNGGPGHNDLVTVVGLVAGANAFFSTARSAFVSLETQMTKVLALSSCRKSTKRRCKSNPVARSRALDSRKQLGNKALLAGTGLGLFVSLVGDASSSSSFLVASGTLSEESDSIDDVG